jgi:peptidoglycan/xylan/chitin deacetylase (PgdA/CDA1 family)
VAARLTRRLVLRLLGADALAPTLRVFGRGLATIFTLHRFANPDLGSRGHDPAALRDHLAYLRRHRYRLLSLAEVVDLLDNGADSATPAVAFTVDDGYAGFAHTAAPIFAEYDCPVTLFVTTGFLDGRLWLWWDRITYVFQQTRRSALTVDFGAEQLRYHWSSPGEKDGARHDVLSRCEWMPAPERDRAIGDIARDLEVDMPATPPPPYAPISWDDVRQTAKRGATFGPHTVTHPILSLATDDVCHWEIRESYRRLREETDAHVPIFCYPNGEPRAIGLREVEAVQREGFKAALTTVQDYAVARGQRRTAKHRFLLPRFAYPDDRPHFVHAVAGLVRVKRMIQGGRRTAPTELAIASAASGLCAG